MMKPDSEESKLRLLLRSVAVNRRLLAEGPVHHLLRLLDATTGAKRPAHIISIWSEYVSSLLPYDLRLETYLRDYLQRTSNELVRAKLRGTPIQPAVLQMMHAELDTLSKACAVSSDSLQIYLDYDGPLPRWETSTPDLFADYEAMLETIPSEGFGMFRECHMFTLHRSQLVPVKAGDPITLDQLQGYTWQRELVLRNVRALLNGKPAADMLLYGDSGTGKSSTIKAVANALWREGLRLIEVRPSQLHAIPRLLQRLAENPLKFLLFIDDLSFTKEDEDFRALKGILEGSVLCRAKNVIVCATSNRRRLIRETFSDRGSDDVHANETIQQQTALSDRFGLSVPFMDPGRAEYLRIVQAAAADLHLDIPESDLLAGAERFALERGGRSGRTARQYVDQVYSGVIHVDGPVISS